MRFLLVNSPIRLDRPPNNYPTGLGIIAAVLLEAGHEVRVLDVNAHRYRPEKVIEIAAAASADVIGISGLISTYRYQEWLIQALKARLPSTRVIAGGGCATSVPELMMTHTPVDYLVIGEGEQTVVELASAIERGDPLEPIRGIAYRREGVVRFTEPRPVAEDLDAFPLPAYHLFPIDIYLKYPIWSFKSPSMNLLSSRGCPMSCRFCYNLFGRRSYRKRGVPAIIEEIRLLKREFGIDTFGFVDDNVTISRGHLAALCEALGQEGVTWGCHGRVDTADDERLALMAASGCKWLGFGIESGSQRILDAMNKRIDVVQARDAIRRTRAHGIFANTTFIYGYPGEDQESIADTLRFKLELDILIDSFYATPYPGTDLYAEARDRGLIPDEVAYVRSLNNAYDFTINLTDMPDDLLKARKKLAYTELNTALTFKHLTTVDKDKREQFLSLADRFLALETFTPESKGEVLLALARFYESEGDADAAFRTRSTALRFGADIEADLARRSPEALPG